MVGVACLKIAEVFNEKSKEYYRQENSTEYSYITADEYTPAEVVSMEKTVLNTLNFDLYSPTSVSFIKVYNQVLKADKKTLMCSYYIADLLLLDSKTSLCPPSLVGSVCLFLGLIACGNSLDVSVFHLTKLYV